MLNFRLSSDDESAPSNLDRLFACQKTKVHLLNLENLTEQTSTMFFTLILKPRDCGMLEIVVRRLR